MKMYQQAIREVIARRRVISAGTPPDNSLIARWKMDEGSGTSLSDETTNYPATLSGASWITGKSGSGGALSFDGIDDYAISDAVIGYSTNVITICAWVKWDSFEDQFHVFLECGTGWFATSYQYAIFMDTTTTGKIRTYMRGFGSGQLVMEHDRPSSAVWQHLAFILDGSTDSGNVKVYLNGALLNGSIVENTRSGTANFSSQRLNIMSRSSGSSLESAGDIDDLRIYSGELEAGEIEYVMENPDS